MSPLKYWRVCLLPPPGRCRDTLGRHLARVLPRSLGARRSPCFGVVLAWPGRTDAPPDAAVAPHWCVQVTTVWSR